ncbi:MAG: YraN family protein [Coriobacteriia bacterium]|nr:YraN family protein [Coriobacteriia bacterium]MBN2840971.1 YraN family protein [Coriobacteriia bacterium]
MTSMDIGRRGEEAAAAYLERQGMRVVDRNWRNGRGEIDIVALDGPDLVICEVKTRASTSAGQPEESVSPAKQRRLMRLAEAYAAAAGLEEVSFRFDVVSILVLRDDRALLKHHRAAFIAA